jgi:hypothetical protein
MKCCATVRPGRLAVQLSKVTLKRSDTPCMLFDWYFELSDQLTLSFDGKVGNLCAATLGKFAVK